MWSQRIFYLGLGLISILGGVVADKPITVDAQDKSITYTTAEGDSGTTWDPVQPGPDDCETPQMITRRLGDYMTFKFTGTGVAVQGTVGVLQGIINFALDGQNVTTFDRGRPQLACDETIFQEASLPLGDHTLVATLVGRGTNPQTGELSGILSVQRIVYSVPDAPESQA